MNTGGDLGRKLRAARELHKFDNIVLVVIDAMDLAVSKVARFGERDRENIRALAQLGLVDMEVFASRAEEALSCYVGDMTFVCCNLADAREMSEKASARTFQPDNAVSHGFSEIMISLAAFCSSLLQGRGVRLFGDRQGLLHM